MYIFEKNMKQPVGAFLQDIHDSMKIKYSFQQQQDAKKASILQEFLQDLKNTAQSSNNFSKGVANSVLQQIKANHSKQYKIEKLFSRRGGQNLETELTDIIEAVYQLSNFNNKSKIDRKLINVGRTQGTVLQGILDDTVLAVLEDMGKNVKKAIDNEGNITKQVSRGMILTEVQQKTDVQGLSLDIPVAINLSYDLSSILSILNEAKISAKNYSSKNRYDEMIDDLYDINIGNSNPYRAFAGALSSLGYGDKTIQSAFYASYNHRHDVNVRAHIYHLRYIYELTGVGSFNSKLKTTDNVNFLVYNDPTGTKIFVVSVGEILMQVLTDNGLFISEDPFAAIKIKRSYFKT